MSIRKYNTFIIYKIKSNDNKLLLLLYALIFYIPNVYLYLYSVKYLVKVLHWLLLQL